MPASLSRVALLGALAVPACSSQDGGVGPGDAAPSRAFGVWQPGSFDSCTRDQHDAFGRRARREALPGSIRQVISPVDREIGTDFVGPSIGDDHMYAGPGVRSPN